MATTEIKADCGCLIEATPSNLWIESITIISPCEIHTAQKKTIERLADALEFALAYPDTTEERLAEWQNYAAKHWNGWNWEKTYEAEAAARALLAEIRGKDA